MTTLGFYFAGLSNEEANEIRATLNKVARDLGYVASRGPTAGEGNAAALLVGISRGEVQVKRTINQASAGRIAAAVEMGATIDAAFIAEWQEYILPVIADSARDHIATQAELWSGAVALILRDKYGLTQAWEQQERIAARLGRL